MLLYLCRHITIPLSVPQVHVVKLVQDAVLVTGGPEVYEGGSELKNVPGGKLGKKKSPVEGSEKASLSNRPEASTTSKHNKQAA